MMVLGVFSKFGALFATIPDPIVGGIFLHHVWHDNSCWIIQFTVCGFELDKKPVCAWILHFLRLGIPF